MIITLEELDRIDRAVIIDMFVEEHGITVNEEQKEALIQLIKDSADWGMKMGKRENREIEI